MADSKLSNLSAVSAVVATDEYYTSQSSVSKKATAAQIKAYTNAGVASLSTSQEWTAPQRGPWTEQASGTFTFATAHNFRIIPTANVTIANPSDIGTALGQSGVIIVNAGTYTVSWGSYWKFNNGEVPTFTGWVSVPYIVDHSTSIVCGTPQVDLLGL